MRAREEACLGAAPVLLGEGEGGERVDAPGAGEPHRLLQQAPPSLVPRRRRQPPRAPKKEGRKNSKANK